MRKMAFNCSFATYASFKSAKCEHKNFFARFFCFFVFQIVSIWRFLCSQFHLKSEQIVSYRFRQLNLTKTICTPLALERHNKNWLPQSLGDRITPVITKEARKKGTDLALTVRERGYLKREHGNPQNTLGCIHYLAEDTAFFLRLCCLSLWRKESEPLEPARWLMDILLNSWPW